MKKLVFAIMMCVSAMSANAQVLTSETVNKVYEDVSNNSKGEYYYNAERKGNNISTMYVYMNTGSRKGDVVLKPHRKYEYDYAADGTLKSRVTYRWNASERNWECASRHDYTLASNSYFAEYSRYNHQKQCFDQPVDKMVYSLHDKDSVNHVICYHRDRPSDLYRMISDTAVNESLYLFAKK
jgi:hypothetical protein